jgi:alkyl sulfatase BDS1-like metallo-beta-lactamase superfamily hydrolase
LNPLSPTEAGSKYVEALGGPDAVLKLGRDALKKGDYRWGAELVNHLVFAQPDNQTAKNLQADLLEQIGYQTENGTWRGFYLSGASELRQGIVKPPAANTAVVDIIANMSSELMFGYMGVLLDAKKADAKRIAINWVFPDRNEKHTLYLENSVLNHWPAYTDVKADATVTLDRATMIKIVTKETTVADAATAGGVKIVGDPTKVADLMGCLVDVSRCFWFNIVTP